MRKLWDRWEFWALLIFVQVWYKLGFYWWQ